MAVGDAALRREAEQWLQWDKNPKTSAIVKELVAEGNVAELQKYFGSRMEFGTAGLRAAMGAGISHMNDLTIIQTTQGFCRYLEKNFSDLKKRGVVIGFDARAHLSSGGSSKRFARLAANTFISQGVPVYLFSDITPTPFVPYTVTHLKLCAGIMVTASHNPKQDNGYKVYWENGAQIISPHDKGISQAIEENKEPWPQAWDDKQIDSSVLLHDPYATINKEYFKDIQKQCFHRKINKETNLKFVHTSVHGVGHKFVQLAFQAFDLRPPFAVPEQKDPDPEFPTVKYPNPALVPAPRRIRVFCAVARGRRSAAETLPQKQCSRRAARCRAAGALLSRRGPGRAPVALRPRRLLLFLPPIPPRKEAASGSRGARGTAWPAAGTGGRSLPAAPCPLVAPDPSPPLFLSLPPLRREQAGGAARRGRSERSADFCCS